MMKRHSTPMVQRGFTIIEVMVAFGVLAFGLLAIASFQSKLVSSSSYNKARSEAIALAEQKLDEIRSYTDEQTLVANLAGSNILDEADTFPASVNDGDFPATAEALPGVNADFSRQWNVVVVGDSADVAVTVSWDDVRLGTQSVSLDTTVVWRNPRGSADITEVEEPLVPSATGRAYLGDGHVDPNSIPSSDDNGDGTSDADFDHDGDLELVDNTSGDVVLTLKDACNLETGVCSDFVRIRGRVYRDVPGSGLALADTYVLASDAAFCARDLVNAGTTAPNANYQYYDYTCYLGGGWHGNIGLLMVGANSNDAACVGDPYNRTPQLRDPAVPNDYIRWYEDPDLGTNGADAWKRVELATRRVYRGMIHKVDGNGDEITNADGDTLFYSQGIADAVQLPDPGEVAADGTVLRLPYRYYSHNFVVTRVTGAGTGGGEASDCVPALTRADADPDSDLSTANLFDGVSGDFVCLNSDDILNTYVSGVDANLYSRYLDNFDEAVYRARNSCPYDPSDPPSRRFIISGTIATSTEPDSMEVITSDGDGNCTWTIGATSTSYACDVYAWENSSGVVSGWGGVITVLPPADMLCAVNPVDVSTVYTNPVSRSYAAITVNQQNQNYTCNNLDTMFIGGTITAPGSDLSGGSVTRDDGTPCTYVSAGASATYSCKVIEPSVGSGWTGTVTFTPPSHIPADACTPLSWSFGVSDSPVHSYETWRLTDNNSSCSVPQPAYVYGLVSTTSGVDLYNLAFTADNGSCWTDYYNIPAYLGSGVYYVCEVTHFGAGWNGTITFDSGDPDIRCSPGSYYTSGAIGDTQGTTPVSCDYDYSGAVTVSGSITAYEVASNRAQPGTPVLRSNGVVVPNACILNNGNAVPNSSVPITVPYRCTTEVIAGDATWTGSVEFIDNGAKTVCTDTPNHTNPRNFSGIAPRTAVVDDAANGYYTNAYIAATAVKCPSTLP